VPVLVIGADCHATSAIVAALQKRVGPVSVLLEAPLPIWRTVRARARTQGLLRMLGQILVQMSVPLQRWCRRRRLLELEAATPGGLVGGQHFGTVKSINSAAARSVIRAVAPKVVVVSGTRIIGRKTLASGPTFVNMHAGLTPAYRGVHGGYWAMANGRPGEFGVTVHLVDEGVDTGSVLHQATGIPEKTDGYVTYPLLQLKLGLPGLVSVVASLVGGVSVGVLDTGGQASRQYYHPTVVEFIKNGLSKGAW
jgi:hypothetical protein